MLEPQLIQNTIANHAQPLSGTPFSDFDSLNVEYAHVKDICRRASSSAVVLQWYLCSGDPRLRRYA